MEKKQSNEFLVKEKNYPRLSLSLNKLNNIIRNVEEESHQEFYKEAYGDGGSYRSKNFRYWIVFFVSFFPIVFSFIPLAYAVKIIKAGGYIHFIWKPICLFLFLTFLGIMFGIGVQSSKAFNAIFIHIRDFDSEEALKSRSKRVIRQMLGTTSLDRNIDEYRELLKEVNNRLSEKDSNWTSFLSAEGYMATITLLSPTLAVLSQEKVKIDTLFIVFITIFVVVNVVYFVMYFGGKKLFNSLKPDVILELRFTEMAQLLRCKKYIETILTYRLVESKNIAGQDLEQIDHVEALLASNKEIAEVLHAIQKEIADLNYPRKIKEKLRERN